jgi:Zn-finger nucleic acid-binding protein
MSVNVKNWCPVCKSENLTADYDGAFGEIELYYECPVCGSVWYAKYAETKKVIEKRRVKPFSPAPRRRGVDE